MSSRYDIGFGPLTGPRRDLASMVGDPPPGAVLDDGTTAANPPPADGSTMVVPGLSLTTSTYVDGQGNLRAEVRAQWGIPPQGESEIDLNKVKNYEISYSDGMGRGWGPNRPTEVRDVTIRSLPIERDILVRVRGVTGKGFRGPWAESFVRTTRDNEPPPVPSKPTVNGTLRGASVSWDGLFVGSAPRPDDFRYVIVQMSLDPAFPPASIIQGGFLGEAGRTAVNPVGTAPFTVHARLIAVDHSGNKSVPSEVATGTSIKVIPEDVGEKAITTAALNDAAVSAEKILNGAIDTFKLADGAVSGLKLADLAVTTGKIVDGAIDSVKLAVNSVTPAKIVDGAVVASKLADLAVTAQKVADNAIITSKISNNAVDNLKLLAGSVTTEKVAEAAITTDLLAQFAVKAQNVGFGIGGANQLENSSFEDGLTGWAVENGMTIASVTGALVHGTMAMESTTDPNVGTSPALTP